MIEATWSTVKAFIDSKEAKYNYVDTFGMYEIITIVGAFQVEARIVKTSPRSSDQADFEDNYKSNANNIPLDGAHKNVTDIASSTITYKGSTVDTDAGETAAKWCVQRIIKSGAKTTESFAGGGANDFSQKFSDRVTLFPVPDFDNTLSTRFDGVNDYINYGNVFNYDHSNAFSISFWCKPDNIAATRNLLAKATDDANVYGFNLRHTVTTGALFLQARSSDSLRQFTFDTALTASVWQHIVLTFNGNSNINGFRVYRNAVVGTTPTSGAIGASWLSGQDFTLGSRNAVFEFSGYMDEFTVWNKGLSQSEVTAIYNTGTPRDPTQESFESDLVTYSPLGDGDTAGTVLDNKGSNDGTMTNFSAEPFEAEVP